MSENEHVWDEVQRVAVSRFSGASVDDDDIMRQVDLMEAALNPNRQGAGGGMGGGGMMPPMMMGGMGAGGGGGASGGGGGGLGGGIGAGVSPAPNMPQASAGVGLGVSAAQAPVAEEVDEVEVPEMGGIGGGLGGGPGGGGGPGEDPSGGLPIDELGAPQPGAAGPPADGFSADPEAVRGLATRWAEVAQELQGLAVPVLDIGLGIVHPAERPQQAVNQQLIAWTGSAMGEFEAMASRLQDVAGQYEAVEDDGIGAIKKETVDG